MDNADSSDAGRIRCEIFAAAERSDAEISAAIFCRAFCKSTAYRIAAYKNSYDDGYCKEICKTRHNGFPFSEGELCLF